MILDYFVKEMNMNLKVSYLTEIYDTKTNTYKSSWAVRSGDVGVPCCLYSKSMAEKYFGTGFWAQEVDYVACLRPIEVTNKDRIIINDDKEYYIDSVDDVAFQGEVQLIGLRRVS